jgi:hypothetical protein
VSLPATSQTIDRIDSLGGAAPQAGGQSLRCGTIAVGPRGVPHVLYSTADAERGDLLLARPDKAGKWQRRSIGRQAASIWGTPPRKNAAGTPRPGWRLKLPGGLTFDETGRLLAVATLCRPDPARKESLWGHPTNEVAWLELRSDGALLGAAFLSTRQPTRAHWLPNLERPTGWNRVEQPGLIYTAGPRGRKNTDLLSNKVYWVRPARPRQ